jgi:hypothetical protein
MKTDELIPYLLKSFTGLFNMWSWWKNSLCSKGNIKRLGMLLQPWFQYFIKKTVLL